MVELVELEKHTLTVRVDHEREYTLYHVGDRTVVLDYDIIDDYIDAAWIWDALGGDDFSIDLSSSYFIQANEIPESWRGGIR